MTEQELYSKYLRHAMYYYDIRGLLWEKMLSSKVENKHPWQKFINVNLYKVLKANPVALGLKHKISGIGYLGNIDNERCYVLFCFDDKPDMITSIGIIKRSGFVCVPISIGPVFGVTAIVRNQYFWMDILLGTEKLQELCDTYNTILDCIGMSDTYGVFEGQSESVERLRGLIESLEVGEGKPYIVDTYGKRVWID